MLCSGKRYQRVAEMSEIADLLKTWMGEAHSKACRQEERREQAGSEFVTQKNEPNLRAEAL